MPQARDIDEVERKVARLIDSIVVGSWIRGINGEPGFWSHEVFNLFGLPVSEQAPPAETLLRHLDVTGQTRMWGAVERCRDGQVPFAIEYSIRTSQGLSRRLKSVGQTVRAASGETLIIGTVQDITAFEPLRLEVQGLAQTLRRVQRARQAEGFSPAQWDRIETLIRDREGRGLSVRELADQVKLKPADFARRFKATTGETPHQYLLGRRLARASEALRGAPRLSVAQVAAENGFFDQAHFTRHFKRRYGLTPSRFARAIASATL